MKTPDHFLIKGERWKVSVKEKVVCDEELCDGLTLSESREIEVSESLSGRRFDHVLLHEFLHAVLHELHIHNLEEQEEEVIVDGIAKCLLDSFDMEVKRGE